MRHNGRAKKRAFPNLTGLPPFMNSNKRSNTFYLTLIANVTAPFFVYSPT
jgi:hypothetical protein